MAAVQDSIDAVRIAAAAADSQKADTESTTEADNTEFKAAKPVVTETGTPYDNHGKLSVNGTDIVDKDGNKYQLKGVSTVQVLCSCEDCVEKAVLALETL